jgi:hypothetical protein
MSIRYYGDNTRWFVADVIDTTPPYGLEGRCRIRIHGVHNPSTREVKQNDLPWAQMLLPNTEGGVSGLGSTPRLEAGALVFGMFMDGSESQVPVVFGSLPRTEYPSAVQQNVAYRDLAERARPDQEFYNLSVGSIDEYDNALKNEVRDQKIETTTANYRRDIAVKFFMSNGYTIKQSCALVGAISYTTSTFDTTNQKNNGVGLMGWSDTRFTRLKAFSNAWWHFSTQLAFILFELNTTHVDANIRILNSDVIDKSKPKSLGNIIGRHYAPILDDYTGEVKRIYEIYANKKV